MSGPITPITTAPAAFTGIVKKVNEVIAANPPLQAGAGIQIQDAKYNQTVSVVLTQEMIDPFLEALKKQIPIVEYEEFTVCVSGTPTQMLIAVKAI
jgi:hypothetical protein